MHECQQVVCCSSVTEWREEPQCVQQVMPFIYQVVGVLCGFFQSGSLCFTAKTTILGADMQMSEKENVAVEIRLC